MSRLYAQRGFSLLEILVAFAILAISLGVLMQIFSRASLSAIAAAQYSRAASIAEARLEAVGTAIPLEPGLVSGEPEDGIAWELAIVPVELGQDPGMELGAMPSLMPYRVTAIVLWKDRGRVRRLVLSTLRLGAPLE